MTCPLLPGIRSNIAKDIACNSPPQMIINTFDLRNKTIVWSIGESSIMPKDSGIVGDCGKWATNPVPYQEEVTYAFKI